MHNRSAAPLYRVRAPSKKTLALKLCWLGTTAVFCLILFDTSGTTHHSAADLPLHQLRPTLERSQYRTKHHSAKVRAGSVVPAPIVPPSAAESESYIGDDELADDQRKREADVMELVRRVTHGLAPYMRRFLKMTHREKLMAEAKQQAHRSLKSAKSMCAQDPNCGGVVKNGAHYEMRYGGNPEESGSDESCWVKIPCDPDVADTTTKQIVKAFYDSVSSALSDPKLPTFQRSPPKVRDDGSIFISIASYRDDTCPASLRSMFKKAKNPEKMTVGVIQQNCEAECETGTGWANTRRLVPTDPDPSCVDDFCKSDFGKVHCDAGRVRLLKLQEYEAWGPFFARFLASKIWNGQNYILQIDAHTQFRQGWDQALIEMIQATPSFPNSVLTTYPDSFSGSFSDHASPLCGFTFEGTGTGKTIRLQQSFGSRSNKKYARAAFIAAGFFFTHGSAFVKIPFDPYLPYIFMGEEIAMSSRFWTSGFDIYAPTQSQLKHAYVRAESSKFWETVNRVFSDPGAHNAITDLVMSRIQHLLRFPGMEKENIKPSWLLRDMEKYQQSTIRTYDQFMKYHNIDLKNSVQRPPTWCSPGGEEPPWVN